MRITPTSPAVTIEPWRWRVVWLMFLATMLNYMDRQTLSQLAATICSEYGLSNRQ